jgi:hypothetical protein
LLGELEYLANDLCLRLEWNRFAVVQNDTIGDRPNVFSFRTPSRVYRLPFIRASGILHFCGNQLKDGTNRVHCRFELDIAVLTGVEQHSELAKAGDRSDAIERHSSDSVNSDHQHALRTEGFGRSLKLVDEIAKNLASAFGARADTAKLPPDNPSIARRSLVGPLLLVLQRRLLR